MLDGPNKILVFSSNWFDLVQVCKLSGVEINYQNRSCSSVSHESNSSLGICMCFADISYQESHPFTRKCAIYHNAWLTLQQIQKSNTSEGTDIVLAVGWDPLNPTPPPWHAVAVLGGIQPQHAAAPRCIREIIMRLVSFCCCCCWNLWLQEVVSGVRKALQHSQSDILRLNNTLQTLVSTPWLKTT